MIAELLCVGIGGFLGACARYLITLTSKNFGISFPFGTLISNVVAGFLIGFIIGAEQQTTELSPKIKLFLTTGFLGGLSTFSAFSLETVDFLATEKYVLAILNVFLNLALSFAGVILGFAAAKLMFSAVKV
ncbi:putative fluoride ion transporter CrcB [Methanosarcinaceae archaeon Ag5]|uniref:Fluoride-specific ion channel FluC n=1 Tax=Methanolapillus africanus TaxID=3028297 RepID=A0AAE4SFH8_9EURY|nr:putative fluoride ion transporter CrcB [Methanosarcinaceae archaeon Ag5]